jgi:D-galactarolactone cycloisomerase
MAAAGSKVVRIDGYEVSCTLPKPVGNSRGFFEKRPSLLIALTTADGIVGWGETWAQPAAAAALIRGTLAKHVLGRDAMTPRPVWDAMARETGTYDRRGITHMAISALDIALWDAASRTAEMPLSKFLGGALRDRVPAYVSGPFMKPGADPYLNYESEIEGFLQAGFKAIKLRMGTSPANDGRLIERVRKIIGPDMPLMVDLNEGFTTHAALAIANAIAPANLVWLEEPILHTDLDGYRRLSASLPMALSGGEALIGLGAFRDFLSVGVLDLAQPDLALCGGISEGLRIAALADAFEVPIVPHVWGTAVNFYASLHFTAILPAKRGPGVTYPMFEYDTSFNPLRTLFGEYPLDGAGNVAVPDGPGLGFALTTDRLSPFVTNHWHID